MKPDDIIERAGPIVRIAERIKKVMLDTQELKLVSRTKNV